MRRGDLLETRKEPALDQRVSGKVGGAEPDEKDVDRAVVQKKKEGVGGFSLLRKAGRTHRGTRKKNHAPCRAFRENWKSAYLFGGNRAASDVDPPGRGPSLRFSNGGETG